MTDQASGYRAVGREARRMDGPGKVTGNTRYTSDISLPRMWHAKVVRSPHPHARVVNVDRSAAEEMGAVVITAGDVPGSRYNERTISLPEATYRDMTVLTDHPRHVGDAVAAVAAETEHLAERAAEAVEVEYQRYEPALTTEKATDPATDPIHESVVVDGEEVPIHDNVAVERDLSVGDVEAGFAEADHVFEDEFETGRTYHAQMETKSAVCRPEPDGGITVWTTTQTIHNVRQLLGEIFELPLTDVNVKKVPIGGSFGSSIQMNSITPIAVALARAADRPVRLVSNRDEDMYDHCRYPTRMWIRIGVNDDGTFVAGEMDITADIGAHNIQAFPFLGVVGGFMASLYNLDHLRYTGRAIYTNKAPACAMQGFGNPQVTFAVESMVARIADELGIDQLDLIRRNYVGEGDLFWAQGPTIKSIVKSCGVEELLEIGADEIGWSDREPPEVKQGRYRRGIGMARGLHTSGTGGPIPGEAIDYSGAMVKVNEDGSVDVVTALQDHGGGTLDAGRKMVAEVLCLPLERVSMSSTDTKNTVYDVCTHATRGVYAGGAAMLKAANEAREQLLEFASRVLEVQPGAIQIEPDEDANDVRLFVEGVPEKQTTLSEVAKTAELETWGTIAAVVSNRQFSAPPSYSAQFVEVEVDMETGFIQPIRVVLGNDAGTIINPKGAKGQQVGGFHRGVGYALFEDTVYDEGSGRLVNPNLADYVVPGAGVMPPVENIETFFVETDEPSGPFGAKGIAEPCINPTAAAIANAVHNATGIRFTEIPMRPDAVAMETRERLQRETTSTETAPAQD